MNALNILKNTPLFLGIEPEDIQKMLVCFGARQAAYSAGETLLWEDTAVDEVGVLLSGSAYAVHTDRFGNETILTHVLQGQLFGDVLAAGKEQKSPVTVRAQTEVRVLFIPFSTLFMRCAKGCVGHDVLLRNYINILAEKYFRLHTRIYCITQPTVREKIRFYLQEVQKQTDSTTFTIPFNRAALAAYLNVERSALSRELSAMKKDGILHYDKNQFTLIGI